MTLRKKVLPGSNGQGLAFLAGKVISDDGKRSVYLTNHLSEGDPNYLLWNVETTDEEKGTLEIWPYKGENTEALIKELMEDFIENAFKKEEKPDSNNNNQKVKNNAENNNNNPKIPNEKSLTAFEKLTKLAEKAKTEEA